MNGGGRPGTGTRPGSRFRPGVDGEFPKTKGMVELLGLTFAELAVVLVVVGLVVGLSFPLRSHNLRAERDGARVSVDADVGADGKSTAPEKR